MTSAIDKNCTFLIANDKAGTVSQEDICKDLEKNEVESKVRYATLTIRVLPFFDRLCNLSFH